MGRHRMSVAAWRRRLRVACQASRMPGPQPSLILALRTEPARRAFWEPEMGANVFSRPQTQRDVNSGHRPQGLLLRRHFRNVPW
jgi:hypothetical protein